MTYIIHKKNFEEEWTAAWQAVQVQKKGFPAKKFSGILRGKLKTSPLALQKKWRDEWE